MSALASQIAAAGPMAAHSIEKPDSGFLEAVVGD